MVDYYNELDDIELKETNNQNVRLQTDYIEFIQRTRGEKGDSPLTLANIFRMHWDCKATPLKKKKKNIFLLTTHISIKKGKIEAPLSG